MDIVEGALMDCPCTTLGGQISDRNQLRIALMAPDRPVTYFLQGLVTATLIPE